MAADEENRVILDGLLATPERTTSHLVELCTPSALDSAFGSWAHISCRKGVTEMQVCKEDGAG